MRRRAPAFQFYPGDFLSDPKVEVMTLEEQGAYVRLLCHAWLSRPVGAIPCDWSTVVQLARISDAKKVRKDELLAPFKRSRNGKYLESPRLKREHKKQQAFIAQRVNAGRASAAARQRKRNGRSTGVDFSLNENPTLQSSDFINTPPKPPKGGKVSKRQARKDQDAEREATWRRYDDMPNAAKLRLTEQVTGSEHGCYDTGAKPIIGKMARVLALWDQENVK